MRQNVSRLVLGVAIVTTLVAAGCGSSSKSTSPTSTASGSPTSSSGPGAAKGTPIKIGFIYSATGPAAPGYQNSQLAAEARIDAVNAAGGVNGHPIDLIIHDDQSTPTGNLAAAQYLIESAGVFGIIDDSIYTFGSYSYMQKQGVPVVGAAIDGPEWGSLPNTNMFSVSPPVFSPINGKYYAYTDTAKFLKAIGVTKLSGLVLNVESAIQSQSSTFQTAESLGISNCYNNTSIPIGATDFTSDVLQIKALGCNGVIGVTQLATDVAIAQTIKNANISPKQVYYTAYDQNLISNPNATAPMVGAYTSASANFTNPNQAASLMLQRIKQYAGLTVAIPGLNLVYGYASADLFALGLQMAGANPTRQTFMSKLRQVGNYSAEGLLASPSRSRTSEQWASSSRPGANTSSRYRATATCRTTAASRSAATWSPPTRPDGCSEWLPVPRGARIRVGRASWRSRP